MNTVKWELEDLAFATLHPKVYDEIVRLVAERAPARDEFLATRDRPGATATCGPPRSRPRSPAGPKHYYSIYQKMIVRGREFTDIYDLVGIRVLTESLRDCYAVLGVLHARWNPVPGRFKDFVAMPKFNMYQSLHTTVIGPGRQAGRAADPHVRHAPPGRVRRRGALEVQGGRPRRASTPTARSPATTAASDDMAWVRQLMDWQRETEDPGEFLDSLRFEINSTEVYVFTPRGEVIALPTGSTPVDFAYAIHTEVGHRCIGARVNGRLVPLESQLDNGDVVEVFTSKAQNAGPSRDWLTFVKSPRARNKIKQFFTKERREEAIEQGKDALARLMRREGLPLQRMLTHETLSVVASDLRHPDVTALYAAVGEGNTTAQTVVRRILELFGGEAAADEAAETVTITSERERRKQSPRGDAGVIVKGTQRRLGQAGALLHAGAGRRDRRLRDPRRRGVGAPRRLHQHQEPVVAARADGRGRVGADGAVDVPRRDPGRGARPRAAAQRHHPGAVRRARQHLVGVGRDHPRPDRQEPLHLRDGRPDAPRPRPQGRPHRRRRLRRLPRHPVDRDLGRRRPSSQIRRARRRDCGLSRRTLSRAFLASSSHDWRASMPALASAAFFSLPAASALARSASRRRSTPRAAPRCRRRGRGPPGCDRRHRSSSAPRIGLLDLLEPALEVLHVRARHLAGGVPLVGEVAERIARGLGVRRPAAAPRPRRAAPRFTSALAAYSASSLAFVCVAGTEERVLRGPEPLPQRVVDVLLRAAGRLPLLHQVAVGACGRAPVGRRRRAPRPRRRASP